ncbi:MAG: phytanoyl-CoA dioxygenase family protein [Candidatus Rokuibacteriota bacterium]
MTTAVGVLARQWEVAGFIPAVDVLSAEEAARWRALFDVLEGRVGRESAEIKLHNRHFDEEFVWRLATHPRVLDAIEAVMGSDILLLSSHFFCKYPAEERGERFVAWHQDVTYWGLEPPFAVSAWLAIDDADEANGCMRFVPGSHRGGVLAHGKSGQAGNLLSIDQEVPRDLVDERRAVSIPLRAGQMSMHHGLMLHASHVNRSSRRRCGLTLRYVPPHVRQTVPNSLGQWWAAVLVRGEDRYRHFPPRQVPWAS